MTGGEKRSSSPSAQQESGNGHSKHADTKKARLDPDSLDALNKSMETEEGEKQSKNGAEHAKKRPAEHKNGRGDGDEAPDDEIDAKTVEQDAPASEATHGVDETTARQRVETIYGLKMPKDFVDFWEFCCQINPMIPHTALTELSLETCGPFDFLAGEITVKSSNLEITEKKAMTHWRFYYDTPEVQTILHDVSDDSSQKHYGYYRESPTDLPIFIVVNDSEQDCKLQDVGTNLFAVVYKIAEDRLKDAKEEGRAAILEFSEQIKAHAEKCGHSVGVHVHPRIRGPKVADAPNGMGLLSGKHHEMSLEKKHHLSHAGMDHILADLEETDGESKTERDEANKKLKDLEEQVAADSEDGNYGTMLELGLALFCRGSEQLDKRASTLLSTAYKAMGKDKFAEIAEAHLADRQRSGQLSRFGANAV